MENEHKRSLLERYAVSILIALVALGVLLLQSGKTGGETSALSDAEYGALREQVVPQEGIEVPVVWGDMGKRLVGSGAIDREKLVSLYGDLSEEEKQLLDGDNPKPIRITRENAPYLLNLLWAFGLANSNPILEDKTEMMDSAYGGAGGFASTGGWTLASGETMEHYGRHSLVVLTPEQQALVEKVSKGVFRPCCDNSTHFPDCNHGMAMLGLLELLASQGASEEEMWDASLVVNSYWFPDTYQTIATYMKERGVEWGAVSAREILGADYSSASGYARIASEVLSSGEQEGRCGV